ncbi:MAG: site-2 protease family protein [Opitutaceae bacterium]|nr:site-2 protease family protein [Opitutaceae bacterium]
MLSWSIKLFRIAGIRLEVHATFFLLLAYVGWEGWTEAGGTGLFWRVLTISAFFVCVVLHELGHSFTARGYGVGISRILLMPIGGMAEFDSLPRAPRKELLITLAGPAVNFVLAALLWWPVAHMPDTIYFYSFNGLIYQLLIANLVMGVFNLVPVFPMDGGRILRALLATRYPYLKATKIAATVGKVFAVIGILVMLFWLDSVLGALLFTFILFAGEAEYRAVKRREAEDAHWRQMLERFYGRPPDRPIINVTE